MWWSCAEDKYNYLQEIKNRAAYFEIREKDALNTSNASVYPACKKITKAIIKYRNNRKKINKSII